jgi:hypothetical protein
MSEQPGRDAEHDVDIDVEQADVETAEPPRATSGDSYEDTPDELGGTGGPDAGGAG